MPIKMSNINKTCPESDIFEALLSLDGQNILELGCGEAQLTRLIAQGGAARQIMATEVDDVQHHKNLLITDLPNVVFARCASEYIEAKDNTFDTVFMFKSFHHVPIELMPQALLEIKRVLKINGYLYISEPIFMGEFNEILRLFHDEQRVREAAFTEIQTAITHKQYVLEKELFFNSPVHFDNFSHFEQQVIGVTHSEHQLSDELYEKVKQRFNHYFSHNKGHFVIPIRVNLLRNIDYADEA